MKSTSGKYFIGLDHIRAIAAFIVFIWHFIQVNNGHKAPPPIFPLSILTEGHTGVALFMVLSGYLFTKLLDGKNIAYRPFIWNRFLRLAPLLIVVIFLAGLQRYLAGDNLRYYIEDVVFSVITPSLINGRWSVTVEFHFYLILPLLLFLKNKWKYSLLLVILAAIVMRLFLYQALGEIQTLSYWTIIGRVDQFVLGILAYQFRANISGKHFLVMGTLFLFACFYWYFDSQGGFFMSPSYPSPNPIWIYMPTVEGVVYALIVAWYDNSFKHATGKVSRFIARIGTYSYSIYLLHFFVVFKVPREFNKLVDLSNMYVALLFSVLFFLLMIPIGYISYTYIELPFLRFRKKYIIVDNPQKESL